MTESTTSNMMQEIVSDFESLVESLKAAARVRVLDDEVQEAIYGVAYGALAGRNYKQSASLFAFLAAQRPTEARYLSGLGLSRVGQEEHLQAVLAFALASHFEPDNPRHLLSLTESLLAIGEADMASHALKALEMAAEGKGEFDGLLQRARSLARLIKNARTAAPAAATP